MIAHIKEFIAFRELLFTWTQRDFKVRYNQSVLGAAWAVLQPLSLMVIFSLIFSIFLKIPTGGIAYPVFAYTALLPWTFFSNALSFAIPSLVNNMSLVSKIYFPREILPLSSILVGFADYLIAGVIFIFLMLFYRVPVGPMILLAPLALAVQLILTYGISLIGSALMVFFRDVRFVIPLMLQIWMYLCPVIYPVSTVPEKYQWLYFINPMAVIIDTYRRTILYNQPPDWPYLTLAVLISVLILVVGYRYFKKAETEFADQI
jgi:lipopolysaccharide transport system permease protein